MAMGTAAAGAQEPSRLPASLFSIAPGVDGLQLVDVIDRSEIELSGIRNVWDLLLGRSGYNYFGVRASFSPLPYRVAVLVNGRWLDDLLFDLDSFPTSAIERIEILASGSVALHGAQTHVGAINIVLRNDIEGIEVESGGEHPTGRGGDTMHASGLWGRALGAGRVTLGVDSFHRDRIRAAAREYSRSSWTPGGLFADTNQVSTAGNSVFFLYPGNRPPTAHSLGPCAGDGYTGVLREPFGVPGQGCGYAWSEHEWRWEQRERQSVFLAAEHPVGDRKTMYFDARLVDGGYIRPHLSPAATVFTFHRGAELAGWRDPSSPLRQGLDPAPEPVAPAAVFVRHRFAGHGPRGFRAELKEHDLTLGVAGELPQEIRFDAYLRSHRHDEEMNAGTFVQESRIAGEIAAGRYNLADPLDPSPGNRQAIRDSGLRLHRDSVTEYRVSRATLQGKAFELAGGGARWHAGMELAHNSRLYRPVYRNAAGAAVPQATPDAESMHDVIGWFDITFSGERERFSQFAEVSLPVTPAWEVVLAARHDGHDDVGSTTARQVAARYRLFDGASLRGSWSAAGQPPRIGALRFAQVITNPRVSDPLTGFTYPVVSVNFGNPDLEPEQGERLGLGFEIKMGPATWSADWYRSRFSRLLTVYSAQQAFDLEAAGALDAYGDITVLRPYLRPGETPQPGDFRSIATHVRKPVLDSGEIDSAGLHLRASWDWQADWAGYALDTHWFYRDKYERRAFGNRLPVEFPRHRAHASLGVTRGDVTAHWTTYGVSGFWDTSRSDRYDSWIGHDVALRWRNAFGLSGTDLVGGILNLDNHSPSLNPAAPFHPAETLDSIRGRTLFVSVRRTW